MEVRELAMAIVIMGGIISGFSGFYLSMANNHNLDITDDLGTFNRLNEMNNLSYGIENTVFSGFKDVPILGEVAAVTVSAMNALSYIFSLPGIIIDVTTSLAGLAHLPIWIIQMVNALVFILIVFTVLSAYLKWRI